MLEQQSLVKKAQRTSANACKTLPSENLQQALVV